MKVFGTSLEECLIESVKDELGNNFMHLTDCRYAEDMWKPFVDKKDVVLL